MTSFLDAFFTTPAMARALGDDALIRQMCAFEAALARAEGQEGVIPPGAVHIIAKVASGFVLPDDAARNTLFADAAKAGTLAIPLIKLLTAAVKAQDAGAASYVHYGATSQDVIDTALVLQLTEAVALLDADLVRLSAAAARLAKEHRATPMLGRTLLQPATPVTFGLKAAQWLVAAVECRARLGVSAKAALVLQFGGAAGTLGALGDKGPAVAKALAAELPMLAQAATPLPWHTRRGALASLCAEVGIICALAGKIARDISLLMQLEVAEAFEPAEAGRGGSSAMPHKRNPVRCMQALAAATRTPHLVATIFSGLVQEHERALGGWQAEWAAVPDLFKSSAGALANMADALGGLIVDEKRMRTNLDALNGLPMTEAAALALAPALGRDVAHSIVEAAARKTAAGEGHLADVLAADPRVAAQLSPADLKRICDPANATGATQAFIDAALAQGKI